VLHLVILRFLELVHYLIFRKGHRVLGTLSPSAKERWGGACAVLSHSRSCHPETGMDTVPITLCYFLSMRQWLMLKNLVMLITFFLPVSHWYSAILYSLQFVVLYQAGVVNQKYYIEGISVHRLSWHCVTVALYWHLTVLLIVLPCCH